jgi:hypothetical protein
MSSEMSQKGRLTITLQGTLIGYYIIVPKRTLHGINKRLDDTISCWN